MTGIRLPPAVSFVICVLIWGTTWLAIKVSYDGFPPLWSAALRFLSAAFIVAAVAVARRNPMPRGRRQIAVIVTVGVLLFGLDYGLIYWGEQFLPSGLTSILFASLPLFTATVSWFVIPDERASLRVVLGIVLGIAGLVTIFSHDLRADRSSLAPGLAILGSALACAIANVTVRRWGRDIEPATLNAGAMLIGGVGHLGASLLLGETLVIPVAVRPWLAVLYLSVFGSVISFLLWWRVLQKWTASRASVLALLTPTVAILVGVAVGERLDALQWIGSAVVLAGVAVAFSPGPKAAAAPPVPAE